MKTAPDESQMPRELARIYQFLGATRGHVGSMPEDQERVRQTVYMVPPGISTILDVGCGDGRIMRHLSSYNSVGVDYAFTSVRNVKGRGVQGSSANLPFGDQSFDLVMCCEVLEHLPRGIFERTLQEVKRVARRYVLVSVPYKENLRRLLTKCQACNKIFHIWGHLRSFSEADLDHHFAPLKPIAARYVGRRPPYFSPAVLWCNQVLGNRWADFAPTTMCPRCGNTSFKPIPRNSITLLCGAINLFTNKCIPVSNCNWIVKLFTR